MYCTHSGRDNMLQNMLLYAGPRDTRNTILPILSSTKAIPEILSNKYFAVIGRCAFTYIKARKLKLSTEVSIDICI